jgi:hypothetical protein
MSLYIHPENQELLWKIVNKNPLIQTYFSSYPANIQEAWFKQTISSFYDQNRNLVANSDQLYEINKNTLSYMIQDVKKNMQYMEEQRFQQRPPQNQDPQIERREPANGEFLKPYSVTENKEDKFTSQYNQYQQNYQTLFDKKVPENIDFREKFNEQPITGNMEDLVQRHLRERDEELKRYAPQPFFGGQLQTNEEPAPTRLTIDPAPENIQLSVDELLPLQRPTQKIPSSDYNVKWLDNENSDKIQSLEQEIVILKNQVLQMSDKISLLINVNKDIFDFSAQRLRMSNITISGGFIFDPQQSSEFRRAAEEYKNS